MHKLRFVYFLVLAPFFLLACSSAKKVNNISVQKSDYNGTWTITDIKTNVPEGYRISNLFNLAPHTAFVNSEWTLHRNGHGIIKLTNGNSQEIYWALNQKDTLPVLQFKKIEAGEKARNVETGYRLTIKDKLPSSFILQMPVPVSNTADGNILLTFTKTTPAAGS